MHKIKKDFFNSALFSIYESAKKNFNESQSHDYTKLCLLRYLKTGSVTAFPQAEIGKEIASNYTPEMVIDELASFMYENAKKNKIENNDLKSVNLDIFNLEMQGLSEGEIVKKLADSMKGKGNKSFSFKKEKMLDVAAQLYEEKEINKIKTEKRKYKVAKGQSMKSLKKYKLAANAKAVTLAAGKCLLLGSLVGLGMIPRYPYRIYTLNSLLTRMAVSSAAFLTVGALGTAIEYVNSNWRKHENISIGEAAERFVSLSSKNTKEIVDKIDPKKEKKYNKQLTKNKLDRELY